MLIQASCQCEQLHWPRGACSALQLAAELMFHQDTVLAAATSVVWYDNLVAASWLKKNPKSLVCLAVFQPEAAATSL